MPIQLSKDQKAQALASLERYLSENLDERLGNIATSALLGFFIDEVGPLIYNQAVADVQERLAARIAELDLEVHEDEFPYWPRQSAAARQRR